MFNSTKALQVVPHKVTYSVGIVMVGKRISKSLIYKDDFTCQHLCEKIKKYFEIADVS